MKNILFQQKKIKLSNKRHFVGNKTDYPACLKILQISLLPKYLKLISKGVLLCAFTYANEGRLKVKAVVTIAVMTTLEVLLDDHLLDNVKCAGF
jgi:hypothetical protein